MNIDFDIDIGSLDIEFDIPMFDNGFKNRYIKPKISNDLPNHKIKYSNALKLAKDIRLEKLSRYDCIVAGNFIFGDFIEAFITHNNAKCKKLTISTLSLDQNNVDSLANLINSNFVDELNLIISDYFYAHEKRSLVPYLYDKLDIDNKFQLAAAGTHTKIVLIETLGGKKIVIHGSANLRSSSNIEQFTIEENNELYDFHLEYHEKIIERYGTINKGINKHKSLRGKVLYDLIQKL